MSNDKGVLRTEVGSTSNRYHIPAVSRTIAVLEDLARTVKPRRLADLVRDLDVPRASLFSILATLAEEGLVVRDGLGYRLGERFTQLASSAIAEPGLTQTTRPVLTWLVSHSGETAQVAVRDGNVARYIDALEGTQTLRVSTWVGKRNSLAHTSIGKALMIDVPSDECRRLLDTLSEDALAVLEEQLVEARRAGYTIDDGEGESGVFCIGAPIRDSRGDVIAAISVSAPQVRLSVARIPRVTELVLRAAAEVSKNLRQSDKVETATTPD
jgi:IclR family acetate operon transcriptional repressor